MINIQDYIYTGKTRLNPGAANYDVQTSTKLFDKLRNCIIQIEKRKPIYIHIIPCT